MHVKEAVARGYTFFVVAFLGILAGALVGQLPEEDEWLFKLDGLLFIAIGIVAVIWYLYGQHRFQRSLVPLALAVAALMAKVLGLILEIKDTADAGDDFVTVQALLLLVLLVLLVIVAAVAYYRTRTPEPEAGGMPIESHVPTQVNAGEAMSTMVTVVVALVALVALVVLSDSFVPPRLHAPS